jgi:HAD superfamily hydrolase (TIGR01509 family)
MAAPSPVATAVLFDIGNVIVRWDPRTLYSKIFPDPAERDRFLADVCTMAWHIEHDRGRPMAEGVAEKIAQFPEHAEAIAAWKDRWFEMISGSIPETVEAIELLHARGVPIYGLTNMPSESLAGAVALSPAFGRLRDIVVSGDEKVIKPDPRIYLIACERAGIQPADFLFVDDSPANVAGARAVGMDAHLFDDPAALRPALEARGLL